MSLNLRARSAHFEHPDNLRSFIELGTTVVGYIFCIYVVYLSYVGHLWLAYVVFLIISSFFMTKLFALFHDCTHDSMFKSETTNILVGRFLSLFITMPFTSWKEEHNDHHSHVVDMEKMDYGDIPLLTVEEFKNRSKLKRMMYSIFRQPIFFLSVAPFLYFFVRARYPGMRTKKVIVSVLMTNVVIAAIYIPLLFYFGLWVMIFVFAGPAYLSGMTGLVLFYLQHNYPDSSWFKTKDWEHENASVEGSSLIVLPQPLEWFSHSIGYHHIHHLNSKIPGYRLRECYDKISEFRILQPLTWGDVISAFKLRLWSYEKNKMITIKEAKFVKT